MKKFLVFLFSLMMIFNVCAISACSNGEDKQTDTVPPTISLSVDKEEIEVGQSVKLTYSVSDDISKAAEIDIVISIKDDNGADVTQIYYSSSTRKFTPTKSGEYTITLKATDVKGNEATKTLTILVKDVEELINLSFLDTPTKTIAGLNTKLYIDVSVLGEEVVPGVTIQLLKLNGSDTTDMTDSIDFSTMFFSVPSGEYKLVLTSSYNGISAKKEHLLSVVEPSENNLVFNFSWADVEGYDYSTMSVFRDGISFKEQTKNSPIVKYTLNDIDGSFRLLYTLKNTVVWSNMRGASDFPTIENTVLSGGTSERVDKTVLMVNENNTHGARVYTEFFGQEELVRQDFIDSVTSENRIRLVRDGKDYTMSISGKLKAAYLAADVLENVNAITFKANGVSCDISDIVVEKITPTADAQMPQAPTFKEVSVHDPSIFKDDDGKYYTFGTHFAVAESSDLFNWTAYSTGGANAWNKLYQESWYQVLANAVEWAEPDGINTTWAPDIIKYHGKYYMYYSLTHAFGSSRSFIGRVESDNVYGPYTNSKEIVKSTGASGSPNAIDPALFYDNQGKLWMAYGSFFGGIYIKELYNVGENYGLPKDDGLGKRIWAGGDGPEGPYIFFNEDNGYYYLMTSHGSLSSNYNMRVARSKNPDGPYVDINGVDVSNDVSGGVKLAGNYIFEGYSRGYAALGHNSVLKENDKYLVVYHTRFKSGANGVSGNHRQQINQLFFNEDGWPILAPNRYAGETLGKVSLSMLAADYDILIHSERSSADFVTSKRYTLTQDGQVKIGTDSVGSYLIKGNYFINITIDGVTYKGVAVPQWNNDLSKAGLSITALSNNGRSLWANTGF